MCLAIPGKITELAPDGHFASVEIEGTVRRVNIGPVREDGVAVDDWVVVYLGLAMSKITSDEAEEHLRLLDELGGVEPDRSSRDGPSRKP